MTWDYNDISATKVVVFNKESGEQFITDKTSVNTVMRAVNAEPKETSEIGVAMLPEVYRGLPDMSLYLQCDYNTTAKRGIVLAYAYRSSSDFVMLHPDENRVMHGVIGEGVHPISLIFETKSGDGGNATEPPRQGQGFDVAMHGGMKITLRAPK